MNPKQLQALAQERAEIILATEDAKERRHILEHLQMSNPSLYAAVKAALKDMELAAA